jgi:endonuclease YncB( thermonuclease family)
MRPEDRRIYGEGKTYDEEAHDTAKMLIVVLTVAAAILAVIITILLFVGCGSTEAQTRSLAAPGLLTRATIVSVTDGDTIKTDKGKVRVLAIDTPEVYFHKECGGPEASRYMKDLLHPGDKVRLYRDKGEPDLDPYNRLLRYVYKTRPGYDDLGREMVRAGWAEVYLKYPTSKTKSYLKDQAVAKRHNRGIWGLCD